MQKKIIALAVAGLVSGAALAADNVTIYGVADMTFDSVAATGGSRAAGLATDPVAAATAVDQGRRSRVNANSSLLGFKGSESLSNGLTAVFQFETGVTLDGSSSGSNSNTLGVTRDSYVGLAGGFGTVVAGNLTGPTRALGAKLDVNAGATGTGANIALIGKMGNLLTYRPYNTTTSAAAAPSSAGTQASLFDTRWANALAYVSPSFSNMTIVAAYVAGENKNAANTVNSYGYDLGLSYDNGPIYAGISYNKANTGATSALAANPSVAIAYFQGGVAVNPTYTANSILGGGAACTVPTVCQLVVDNASDLRLGGYYKLDMGRVGLLYDKTKLNLVGVGTAITQTTWYLSGILNAGGGRVIAQYGKAGNLNASGSVANTGAKHVELGYEYDLSKRTMLKTTYSKITNDSSAGYDFGVNAVGAIGLGSSPTALSFGVRHSF